MKLLTIAVALSLVSMQGAAQSAAGSEGMRPASVIELSAQRKRPRIRIVPRQPAAWDYPRPGYYSWPGPNAVRQCVDWYQTEYRPSGAVVTPQMRCRWVPG